MSPVYKTMVEELNTDALEERNAVLKSIPSTPTMYFSAVSALLYLVNVGLAVSYSATTGVKMKEPGSKVHATDEDISWIASMIAISSVVGGLPAGYLADHFGRKRAIFFTSVPYIASWLMVGLGTNMAWILSGRFLTGLCCGFSTAIAPTYLVEISTLKVRGLLGAGVNAAFACGILMSMSLGKVLSWSWLAIFGGFLSAFAALIILFIPESPHWLISKGKKEEAMKALNFLRRDSQKASEEYQVILKNLSETPSSKISPKDFLQPVIYKPTLLAVALMFFQQFCGVNVLNSYAEEIFSQSGSSLDPSIATIIVGVTQFSSTIVSGALMDKAGRKLLFVLSGIFSCVGLSILGICGHLINSGIMSTTYGWTPILGTVVFIVAFNLGFGSIPWVMAPEMVPIHARSIVVSIAAISSGLFAFTVVKTFDLFRGSMDNYEVFLIYAFISFIGSFLYYILPETKGKSLEEIQAFFQGRMHRTMINE